MAIRALETAAQLSAPSQMVRREKGTVEHNLSNCAPLCGPFELESAQELQPNPFGEIRGKAIRRLYLLPLCTTANSKTRLEHGSRHLIALTCRSMAPNLQGVDSMKSVGSKELCPGHVPMPSTTTIFPPWASRVNLGTPALRPGPWS